MPEKTARALGRGCAQRVALGAVAATAALGLFGGALVLGTLVPLPSSAEPWRPVFEWALQVVAFLAIVAATFLASAAIAVRRTQGWDDAFAEVGIAGNAFFSGRAYHGSWGGRRVDAYVFRGITLDLYVEAPLHTRAAVANRNAVTAIARALFDPPRVPCDAPGFEGLEVHADDPAWAAHLLGDPVAVERIPRLVKDDLVHESRVLVLGPDAVALRMRYLRSADLTPAHVVAWIEGLAEVARRAEDIDPPADVVEETAFERRWRTERGRVWAPVGWFALVATAALTVLTLVIAARILLQSLG